MSDTKETIRLAGFSGEGYREPLHPGSVDAASITTPEDTTDMQEGLPEQLPDNVIAFPLREEQQKSSDTPLPYDPAVAKFLSDGHGENGDSLFNQSFDRRKGTSGMPVIRKAPIEAHVEVDPVSEVPKLSDEDVRQAISDADGLVGVARQDFGRIADKAKKTSSTIKQSVTPEKFERTRTHGEKPKKAPKPLVKDRVPQYKTPKVKEGTSQSNPNLWSNVPRSGILK